jgi:hypothetical protein
MNRHDYAIKNDTGLKRLVSFLFDKIAIKLAQVFLGKWAFQMI